MSLYYAYIQTYINYANSIWASTIRTNIKKIHSEQKHAIRIIFRKDKFSHTKELFVQNKGIKGATKSQREIICVSAAKIAETQP